MSLLNYFYIYYTFSFTLDLLKEINKSFYNEKRYYYYYDYYYAGVCKLQVSLLQNISVKLYRSLTTQPFIPVIRVGYFTQFDRT